MSAIGVIATLRVQPGKEAECEGVFAELAPAVAANGRIGDFSAERSRLNPPAL